MPGPPKALVLTSGLLEPSRYRALGVRVCPLVPIAIAVPMLVVSPLVPPLASYGLTVGAGVLICRTAAKLIPHTDGLRDYHQ